MILESAPRDGGGSGRVANASKPAKSPRDLRCTSDVLGTATLSTDGETIGAMTGEVGTWLRRSSRVNVGDSATDLRRLEMSLAAVTDDVGMTTLLCRGRFDINLAGSQ